MARIVDVLLHDQRAILTICSRITGVAGLRRRDAGVAAPGRAATGVLATIPLALDVTEREGLRRSAGVLREAIASLEVS